MAYVRFELQHPDPPPPPVRGSTLFTSPTQRRSERTYFLDAPYVYIRNNLLTAKRFYFHLSYLKDFLKILMLTMVK